MMIRRRQNDNTFIGCGLPSLIGENDQYLAHFHPIITPVTDIAINVIYIYIIKCMIKKKKKNFLDQKFMCDMIATLDIIG